MVALSAFNRTAISALVALTSTTISTPTNTPTSPAPAFVNASTTPPHAGDLLRNSTHFDPETNGPVADIWGGIDDASRDYQVCGYRDVFDPRGCAQKLKTDMVCQRDPRRHDVDVNICLRRTTPNSDLRPCAAEHGWACGHWGVEGLECYHYPDQRDDFRTAHWPRNMGLCLRPIPLPDEIDFDLLYKTFGQYRVCKYHAELTGDQYWGFSPDWPVQDTTECWAMTDMCVKDPRWGDRYLCLDQRDDRQCRLSEDWYCPTGYRCWPDFRTFHKPQLEPWGWCLQINRGKPVMVAQYPELLGPVAHVDS